MNMPVNSGPRLDRLPLSRFHWKILGLIAGGALIDAFDIYLAGGVLAAMNKEGFSSLAQNAAFLSATFFGMFVGAALAGLIGDRFGRRASYQGNLLMFGAASIAAVFSPNVETLIGLRFLMGVGLGAELVIAAGTLGEFVPPGHRGRWAALLSLIIAAGLPLASWTGYFVIPAFGWRYMFGIAGVAALFIWALRKSMPESPRWLESMGRNDEARATLSAIEAEVSAQHGALPPVEGVKTLTVKAAPLRELFSARILPRLLVAVIIVVTINVTVYGFIVWLPTFFVQQGMTVTKSLGYTTAMTFGAIAGSMLAVFVADRITRVKALVVSSLAIMVLGGTFAMMTSPEAIITVGFLLVSATYFLVSIGQFGFVPELFPTQFRLRGAGFASMLGRGAAIGTPLMTLILFKNYGLAGVLALVIALLGLLITAVCRLKVETSRSSLEDI
ncbi:MFS transporter [Variovorax sp. RCC_210]|uniref:MFS transporter n=1 Tax=Variovorax sp. RCC_210 TaxID=3239217 RepID=UPI0035269B2F